MTQMIKEHGAKVKRNIIIVCKPSGEILSIWEVVVMMMRRLRRKRGKINDSSNLSYNIAICLLLSFET